jgi:mRNA-degrading endonuclease RelE of RelBE toxin-antitoxin system
MKVELTAQAFADLNALQPTQRVRVVDVFERLVEWPSVSGAKPMRRGLKGHYRIRSGDWRIIFKVTPESVVVTRIANRSEVYEE